jgi:hypothetical protein
VCFEPATQIQTVNDYCKVETRDPKTGDIVRYNADDDTTTLGELLRQEKFGAGMADQKNLDMQFAQSIMTDGGFVVSFRWIYACFASLKYHQNARMILSIWMIMPKGWVDKRCVQMP